jgi:hypothetical protein
MSSGKIASLVIAFILGGVVVLLGQGGDKLAFAQSLAEQFQVSSAAAGNASSAWIIDNNKRRVTFCRQTAPNGTGDQLLSFACKSISIP